MGFNKHYLPEPAKMAELIKENGPIAYMTSHRTVEAFLGDKKSVEIIDILQAGMKFGLTDAQMNDALKRAMPDLF